MTGFLTFIFLSRNLTRTSLKLKSESLARLIKLHLILNLVNFSNQNFSNFKSKYKSKLTLDEGYLSAE